MDNTVNCHSCGNALELSSGVVGRGEECPHCRTDVRVCFNCTHYDQASYNECSEPMAERVVDKDRRNFCDYFSLGNMSGKKQGSAKEEALAKLDDLFKK